MSGAAWAYLGALVGVLATLAAAGYGAVRKRPALALPALVPAAAGAGMHAAGHTVTAPAHGWVAALSVSMAALGIVAGSPLTIWVLGRTEPPATVTGPTGGIIVGGRGHDEILRGGTTIGYLERLAVIGAAAVGRLEIVAAVIAVKGLGRFSELSSAIARERFIIGTLVSLLWAGLCGALAWPF